MNLYVESGGRIVRPQRPDDMLATAWRGNPLQEPLPAAVPSRTLLAWSGTLAGGLFEAHPHNWMQPGHDALRAMCRDAAARLEREALALCFQPHCRHVLSDTPSCVAFLEEFAGQPFGVALAPGSILEAAMLDALDEHLPRAFAALGSRCAMVILHDVAPGPGRLEPVPLGAGVLPRDMVVEVLREHVPAERPVVLLPEDLDAQRRWLGC